MYSHVQPWIAIHSHVQPCTCIVCSGDRSEISGFENFSIMQLGGERKITVYIFAIGREQRQEKNELNRPNVALAIKGRLFKRSLC